MYILAYKCRFVTCPISGNRKENRLSQDEKWLPDRNEMHSGNERYRVICDALRQNLCIKEKPLEAVNDAKCALTQFRARHTLSTP